VLSYASDVLGFLRYDNHCVYDIRNIDRRRKTTTLLEDPLKTTSGRFRMQYGISTTFPEKQHAKSSDISAMYLYVIQCLFSMEKISCTAVSSQKKTIISFTFISLSVFPAKKSKISRPIRGNDSHTGFIIYNLKRYKTFSGSQEKQLWQVW
jgi:hypothetical protein